MSIGTLLIAEVHFCIGVHCTCASELWQWYSSGTLVVVVLQWYTSGTQSAPRRRVSIWVQCAPRPRRTRCLLPREFHNGNVTLFCICCFCWGWIPKVSWKCKTYHTTSLNGAGMNSLKLGHRKGGWTKNVAVRQKNGTLQKKSVKMLVFPIMSRCPFCIILIEIHK